MANHLIYSKNLYLKQHAMQTIAWYPWGEEALRIAKTTDKPIFLSIGYAACHWCHVMAEEVFTDNELAYFLNQHFIAIKVDREQRPDLDHVYLMCHQLLSGQSGGWPLNVFLDPKNHLPFYSGTYFPLTTKYGLPGFIDVLKQVLRYYQAHREIIDKQNHRLQCGLNKLINKKEKNDTETVNLSLIDSRRDYLAKIYDAEHGGFGEIPKFSQSQFILGLFDHYQQSLSKVISDEMALAMVEKTLQAMGHSGLYDHIAGGFFRYSVDAAWHIPHFEKMLYDQACLLNVYSYAYFITKKSWYRFIALKTHDWVQSYLYCQDKAYASSQDADSENEEGRYYLWIKEQLCEALSADDYAWLSSYFDLTPRDEIHQQIHLQWQKPWPKVSPQADSLAFHYDEYQQVMEKLAIMRHEREAPSVDEKILTSWNALYLSALFRASVMLSEPELAKKGFKVLNFILHEMWNGHELLGYACEDETLPGFLSDYAFLLDAVLLGLQVSFNSKLWYFALNLAEAMITYFYDPNTARFYESSLRHHETLIYRDFQIKDDVLPSSAAVAVNSLFTLASLANRPKWFDLAKTALLRVWPEVIQNPAYYYTWTKAAQRFITPLPKVIIRGESTEITAWQQTFQAKYWGQMDILAIANDANLPPIWAAYQVKVMAWYCDTLGCKGPFTTLQELLAICP